MAANFNRRRDNAPGMGGIDWQDIRARCGIAAIALGWYGFVIALLGLALGRAS